MRLDHARTTLRALAAQSGRQRGNVQLRTGAAVARLVIDNPTRGNALTARMLLDLADAVERLRQWDGAAIVLEAAGERAFCAGLDLDEVRTLAAAPIGAELASALQAVTDALFDLPAVSIAAVHGPAIGGGAELITACDLRFLSAQASVRFVQARMGVVAGLGGASRLTRLLGRRTALMLLAEAEAIDASRAAELGLADRVVTTDPRLAARAWAQRVAQAPAEAVRALKRQVLAASDPGTQATIFAELWGGPAHRAAMGLAPVTVADAD